MFALGGFTGNHVRDFSDALVPLSWQLGDEVLFLVRNTQSWWLTNCSVVVPRVFKFDDVELDRDDQVRCFPHVSVGLRITKEFDIA